MFCNEYLYTPYLQRGETPGHLAMKIGCPECVTILCKYGANFYIKNNSNESPIDIATAHGNQKCLAVFNNFTSRSHLYYLLLTCATLPERHMWWHFACLNMYCTYTLQELELRKHVMVSTKQHQRQWLRTQVRPTRLSMTCLKNHLGTGESTHLNLLLPPLFAMIRRESFMEHRALSMILPYMVIFCKTVHLWWNWPCHSLFYLWACPLPTSPLFPFIHVHRCR